MMKQLTNFIILTLLLLLALFYVDYGELLEAAQSVKECPERVGEQFQESVNSYIGGLEVTAEVLKPSKCHWWPIGLKCKAGQYY